MKKIISCLILFAVVFSFVSCSSLVKLVPGENGGYVDEKNDIIYLSAPVCFEPVSLGDEYAYYKSSGGTEVVLRTVGEFSPLEWLSESYAGIGSLYYASDVSLPSLFDFGAYEILICVEGDLTMHIGTVDNRAAVERILSHIASTEPCDMPADGVNSYHLKFKSETYTGLYYDILYIITPDAKGWFYDRSTKLAYPAGDAMAGYIYEVDEEVEANDGVKGGSR